MQEPVKLDTFSYDDKIVKKFIFATVFWGAIALLAGVFIAAQLAFWKLNLGFSFSSFGRLRPLHTNAAIFAFVGNAIFAGIYYSTQRLLKTRMGSSLLSALHFWGWQLVILCAAITLPLGMTQGKEYAELEWPIDILIAVVWVVFGINFLISLYKRRERHIYVAIWFYIATIVTVAMLHIVNSLAFPLTLFQSYSIYAGVQDALVQWWYGHNAVAFFLTTPFLGLMYYFVPKVIQKPIYSYRLSIIHFWSLVFIYIWAGPHHLLYSVLPEWAQTLGMVFSLMLLAPSWGGMINGLLTMRGAWNRVRVEPILKFLVAALTFYGMSTFEGPLLSIKSINSVAHFTDWIIGHVHSGVLGWNGLLIFAMLYYLVPKLWNTKLYSEKLVNVHFWLATVGIIGYILSMWTAGITQGMMWRAMDGVRLLYPDFVETVLHLHFLYVIRMGSGMIYLLGFFIMVYNLIKTVRSAPTQVAEPVYQAPPLAPLEHDHTKDPAHRWLEGKMDIFVFFVFVSVVIGSVIEILPSLVAHQYMKPLPEKTPYSALELTGRDIYIREGCYNCHSQQVRPMASEVLRYGPASKPEEFIYDHPFQWGSRRIGPDLARVGGKYPHLWHYRHMLDPRAVTPQSIMPSYPWLYKNRIDFEILERKMRLMRSLGVPYTSEQISHSKEDALAQSIAIGKELGLSEKESKKEIIALIAYLQKLRLASASRNAQ